ncbi:unnamed protein product [Amoebophrya sp. A120]|nr:unnamed protein product [Amoebophrya sp. A120]|eukprot:GSA120T00008099001.1
MARRSSNLTYGTHYLDEGGCERSPAGFTAQQCEAPAHLGCRVVPAQKLGQLHGVSSVDKATQKMFDRASSSSFAVLELQHAKAKIEELQQDKQALREDLLLTKRQMAIASGTRTGILWESATRKVFELAATRDEVEVDHRAQSNIAGPFHPGTSNVRDNSSSTATARATPSLANDTTSLTPAADFERYRMLVKKHLSANFAQHGQQCKLCGTFPTDSNSSLMQLELLKRVHQDAWLRMQQIKEMEREKVVLAVQVEDDTAVARERAAMGREDAESKFVERVVAEVERACEAKRKEDLHALEEKLRANFAEEIDEMKQNQWKKEELLVGERDQVATEKNKVTKQLEDMKKKAQTLEKQVKAMRETAGKADAKREQETANLASELGL